jgi:integrase
MKFQDLAQLYLLLNQDQWKPSYHYKNSCIVNSRFQFFHDLHVKDIKVSTCKLWYNSIKDVGNKQKSNFVTVLRGILDVAFYDDLIQRNPAHQIKLDRYRLKKITPFNADEVKAILEYANDINTNHSFYMATVFYTGMRTGEVLGLKKKDIDLKNKVLHINSSKTRYGDDTPKTFGSIRTLPILDLHVPYIENMLSKHDHDFMLVTQYGEPYSESSTLSRRWWSAMLNELGLNYRRPYNMRHTFATNMLYRNIVTPPELAQLLGHTSTQMIYQRYVSYLERNLERFDRSISVYS